MYIGNEYDRSVAEKELKALKRQLSALKLVTATVDHVRFNKYRDSIKADVIHLQQAIANYHKSRKSLTERTGYDDFVHITRILKIDGYIADKHEIVYGRSSTTSAFDLEDVARLLYMWEIMEGSGATYAVDYIPKLAKKLPSRNGLTPQQLFEKYWVNNQESAQEEFELLNKGVEGEYTSWKKENDYLKYLISTTLEMFEKSPLFVKYGVFYALVKYYFKGKIEEMYTDFYENVPQYVKDMVDNEIVGPQKPKSDEAANN